MRCTYSSILFSLFFIGVIFSIPSSLFAAQNENELEGNKVLMETIVVSGTKTPKLLNNSPVAVEVIEGSTIELLTKGTLADALDFVPGVMVTRSEKDGYNIQMQGFDSKHVLVLINGKPVISPTGSSADLGHISANNIAQIEIVKGASSVMYGSSAMGGVINIITNREHESASVSVELGSYVNNAMEANSARVVSQLINLNASKEIYDWQHSVNVQLMQDAGFDLEPNSIKQDEGELDKIFFNIGSRKQFAHTNLDLGYQYLDEDKTKITGINPGQTKPILYTSDVEQHKFDASVENIIDFWKFNGRYSNHNEVSGAATKRQAKIKLVEIEGLKTLQFGKMRPHNSTDSGQELLVGFVTNYQSMEQLNLVTNEQEIANKERVNTAGYGQFNWIKKDYQILTGLRVQDDSDFGFESALGLSGMLNFGNKINSTQVRFGFDQGYRVPDLKERFFQFDHSSIGYVILGNEDLRPEKANTFSFSLDNRRPILEETGNLSVSFSAHYSETKDFITYVLDPDPTRAEKLGFSDLSFGAFSYVNINEAELSGFDISSELTFESWTMQVNYSYLEAIDKQGNRIAGKPRHQMKMNMGYDFQDQGINSLLYLVYQGDEAIPAEYDSIVGNHHVKVNVKLSQNVTSNLSWHLALDNIFDEHQSTSILEGIYDPRSISSREIKLGATYQF